MNDEIYKRLLETNEDYLKNKFLEKYTKNSLIKLRMWEITFVNTILDNNESLVENGAIEEAREILYNCVRRLLKKLFKDIPDKEYYEIPDKEPIEPGKLICFFCGSENVLLLDDKRSIICEQCGKISGDIKNTGYQQSYRSTTDSYALKQSTNKKDELQSLIKSFDNDYIKRIIEDYNLNFNAQKLRSKEEMIKLHQMRPSSNRRPRNHRTAIIDDIITKQYNIYKNRNQPSEMKNKIKYEISKYFIENFKDLQNGEGFLYLVNVFKLKQPKYFNQLKKVLAKIQKEENGK